MIGPKKTQSEVEKQKQLNGIPISMKATKNLLTDADRQILSNRRQEMSLKDSSNNSQSAKR